MKKFTVLLVLPGASALGVGAAFTYTYLPGPDGGFCQRS